MLTRAVASMREDEAVARLDFRFFFEETLIEKIIHRK